MVSAMEEIRAIDEVRLVFLVWSLIWKKKGRNINLMVLF